MVMEKKRPASADGNKPSSDKPDKRCSVCSVVEGSSKLSRPASADLPKASKPDSTKQPLLRFKPRAFSTDKRSSVCSVEGSSKLSRLASADLSKSSKPGPTKHPLLRVKPRAFSTNRSPKSSGGNTPTRDLSKSTRPGCPCPSGSPKSTGSSASSAFKKWGAPYAQTNKNSTRSCSPNLTIVSLEDNNAFFPNKPLKKNPCLSTETLKFIGGSNPATKQLMQVTLCAANARAPILEVKARKLVPYKHTNKENLIEDLESLKAAVVDQAYHLQLHKSHLLSLREENNQLGEKVGAIESIDGSNAPRTGGEGRLLSKVAGLRTKMSNLEDEITIYQEQIQNLKYKYQVCLTREAIIQRNMAAGDVRRLQKEVQNAKDVLQTLSKHNRKFLHFRNKIIPDLQQSLKKKQEKIKGIKVSIGEVEKLSKQCTDESYANKKAASKAKYQGNSLYNNQKKMRAKLKQEREQKRKMQQDVWVKGYETCLIKKENRVNDKRRQVKEAAMVAKASRAATKAKKGKRL